MFRKLTHISSAIFLLATVAVAQSPKSFKFVSINFPGASATQANGINNHNQIVGSFELGAGCNPTFLNCVDHGFRLISGKFTRFDVSGAVSTSIHGVNDLGDIVGSYRTKDNKTHGFLRLHTGKFTTLNFPDGRGTVAMAVNNALTVVGSASDGLHGFVWKNGKFTQWD
ncbi:MAG TPA: hypothetical protein VGC88_08105, partial [Terriglobales bacterium]